MASDPPTGLVAERLGFATSIRSGSFGARSSGFSNVGSTCSEGGSERTTAGASDKARFVRKSKSNMTQDLIRESLTSHIVQQQIMDQALQDESMSTEGCTSADGAISEDRGLTGMEQMEVAMSKERVAASLKRTIKVVGKNRSRVFLSSTVSKRMLMRAVMADEQQFKTCLTLPMTIIFSSLFVAFFQLHYTTRLIHLQEAAIRERLGDEIYKAETAQDIFDWMSGSLFPWLWSMPNVAGVEPLDSVAARQKLVAGVQLRTARGPSSVPCNWDDTLCNPSSPSVAAQDTALLGWQEAGRRLFSAPAFPSSSWKCWFSSVPDTNADRMADRAAAQARAAERVARQGWQPFRGRMRREKAVARFAAERRLRAARAGLPGPMRRLEGGSRSRAQEATQQRRLAKLMLGWMSKPVNTKGGPTYVKTVPMSMNLTEVQILITSFQDATAPLVRDATLFFSVEFDLKNDDARQGVLTHASINFFMSRGGSIYTALKLTTMVLELNLLAIAILFMFVIALLRLTVVTAITNILATKHGAWRTDVFRFANLVDILLIVCGWLICAFVIIEVQGAQKFLSLWDDYESQRGSVTPGSLQEFDLAQFTKIQDHIQFPRAIAKEQIGIVAEYNVLLVVRFLIATMGHPRLAIITRTLLNGMGDLLHLLFVFILMFFAYVMSGHILLGQRMSELSTLKGSLGYCLRIVFAREFEYTRITQENMVTASFWIITFVLMLVLVMVNMVLAMIFDNYGEVRENVFKNETLLAFLSRLITQLQMQSSWVSNTDLLKRLAALPAGQTCTLRHLSRKFPDVCNVQLQLIFENASQRQTIAHLTSSGSHIPEYIAGALIALRDIREGLSRMRLTSVRLRDKRHEADARPPEPAPEGSKGVCAGIKGDVAIDEVDASDEPPLVAPVWMQGGLLEHLKKQQHAMDIMLRQMDSMKDLLAQRGIKGEADYTVAMPPPPDLPFTDYAGHKRGRLHKGARARRGKEIVSL